MEHGASLKAEYFSCFHPALHLTEKSLQAIADLATNEGLETNNLLLLKIILVVLHSIRNHLN